MTLIRRKSLLSNIENPRSQSRLFEHERHFKVSKNPHVVNEGHHTRSIVHGMIAHSSSLPGEAEVWIGMAATFFQELTDTTNLQTSKC